MPALGLMAGGVHRRAVVQVSWFLSVVMLLLPSGEEGRVLPVVWKRYAVSSAPQLPGLSCYLSHDDIGTGPGCNHMLSGAPMCTFVLIKSLVNLQCGEVLCCSWVLVMYNRTPQWVHRCRTVTQGKHTEHMKCTTE